MVPDQEQVFLSFLWLNDVTLLQEPKDFVMCEHYLVRHHLQVIQALFLEELL